MRIGELARASGITARTVRYYEGIGLLPRPPREPSGYRRYGSDDLSRLPFIVGAKALGLSLEDIRDVLEVSEPGAVSCPHVLALLEARREAIAMWMRQARDVHAELERTIRASRRRLRRSASPEHACPIIDRGLHARVRLRLEDAGSSRQQRVVAEPVSTRAGRGRATPGSLRPSGSAEGQKPF